MLKYTDVREINLRAKHLDAVPILEKVRHGHHYSSCTRHLIFMHFFCLTSQSFVVVAYTEESRTIISRTT